MSDAGLAFWDERAKDHERQKTRLWMAHPVVQRRVRALVTGNPEGDIFWWFLERARQEAKAFPVECLVSIGCGTGELERGIAPGAYARRIVGLDFSADAVRIADETAKAVGFDRIEYRQADLNSFDLATLPCQMMLAQMAVHHVENLEHLFAGAQKALAPNGLLFMNEFIGPARFQWSPSQIRVINRLLATLPPEMQTMADGTRKTNIYRPMMGEMIQADPTESVRSHEIIPVLERYFEVVHYRPYRGGLLHMFLSDIVANFMGHPVLDGYVSLLAELEDMLTEIGILSDDFAVVVARPRPLTQT